MWIFGEETWKDADAALIVWEVWLYIWVERMWKELWLPCHLISVEPYLISWLLTYPEYLQKFES